MTDTTEGKTSTPAAMAPERLAEIKARAQAASDAPWSAYEIGDDGEKLFRYGDFGWYVTGPAGTPEFEDSEQGKSDAEFAAEARRDVPDLLAEVERLANALAIKTEVAKSNQRVVESYAEEVERMLPVVEAARAWRALLVGPPEPYHRAQVRDLIAAIDAHDATAGGDSPVESPADDEHPEKRCHRCGGPNVHAWSAPSPLWNQVMRGGDINGEDRFDGIVCTVCFAELAEEAGIAQRWRFYADRVHVELATVTPSGRVWNPQTWLWEEPGGNSPVESPAAAEEPCPRCGGLDGTHTVRNCAALSPADVPERGVVPIRGVPAPTISTRRNDEPPADYQDGVS